MGAFRGGRISWWALFQELPAVEAVVDHQDVRSQTVARGDLVVGTAVAGRMGVLDNVPVGEDVSDAPAGGQDLPAEGLVQGDRGDALGILHGSRLPWRPADRITSR